MRISHKHELVFISTPKSGSLSGFTLMEKEFGGVRYGRYHQTVVPKNYKHYRRFTFVRNPYDRFASLWYSCVIHGKTGPERAATRYRRKLLPLLGGNDDVLSFGKYLCKVRGKFPIEHIKSQSYHLRGVTKGLKFIHVENASQEFNEWFQGDKEYEVPHMRKRDHRLWDDIKSEELIYYVNQWAKWDFPTCGYPPSSSIVEYL